MKYLAKVLYENQTKNPHQKKKRKTLKSSLLANG